jgi:hypothetical protein
MAKFGKDIDPMVGVRFGEGQDPTKGGRPLSFKAKYKEAYEQNDGVIWIDESVTITREKNGIKQIGLPLTKSEIIIAKLDRLIMSAKNERTSLDAIKFIWEQIDGKPLQEVHQETTFKSLDINIVDTGVPLASSEKDILD